MAEREHARDVRRRHHDGKRWLRRLRIRYEIAILEPALIPLRFNRIRIVPLRKFSHRDQSSESGARLQMGTDAVLRRPDGAARRPTSLACGEPLKPSKFPLHERPATNWRFRF